MYSLLIVDDEKNIRLGLKSMIDREFPGEYMFLFAADGEEALARLDEEAVDLIITDIRMPVMDGIALINELYDREEKPDIIILSGHDDFQYAKAAIRCEVKEYLLKPIVRDELFRVLRKLAAQWQRQEKASGQLESSTLLREEYAASQLNHLFVQEAQDTATAADQLRLAGLDWLSGGYSLALLLQTAGIPGVDRREFAQRIDRVMHMHESAYLKFYDKDGRLVVVSGQTAPFDRLAAYMQSDQVTSFRAGMSDAHEGAASIRTAYEQALQSVGYGLLQTEPGIIRYTDIVKRSANYKLPIEQIQKLGNMLGCEREAEMKRLLQHILDVRDIMRYDIGYLEGISRALNEFVFDSVFQLYGEESVELLKLHRMVGNIYNFAHFHDYYHSVENLLSLLNDYVKRVRAVHNERNDIQKAIAYIQEHYRQDLNMAMVSNYVSLNYSYFSQAFKDYTGETFVSYLRRLRLQKAKELLATTELKVYEISASAGFENVKHFTRVFREVEGVSPLEYRTLKEALSKS